MELLNKILLKTNRIEVVSNKSSLLLKILNQNTQTLQLFTTNIKTKSIYEGHYKCQAARLGLTLLETYDKKGWSAKV